MFEYHEAGEVHWLLVNHGKVNGMDLDMCLAFCKRIEAFEKSAGKCLLIRATNPKKVFSAGIDLKWLIRSEIKCTEKFFPALIQMFESAFYCSKPTVAIVEGAAIAGGCVLASACSARIATENARFGMPTPKLKVPIPQIAHSILHSAAPADIADQLHAGSIYSADLALEHGLVREIVHPDSIETKATEIGMNLIEGFQPNLRDLDQAARFKIADQQMIVAWCTDELRERVQHYIESEL